MVVVDCVEDVAEVLDRQVDSRELAAGNEFLKAEAAVEVDVEVAESAPVILELLFDSTVYAPEHILDMYLFIFGKLFEICVRGGSYRRFRKAVANISDLRRIKTIEITLDCIFEIARVSAGNRRKHRAPKVYVLE